MKRHKLLRALQVVQSRPRLVWSTLLGIAVWAASTAIARHEATRILLGWNTGVICYLTMAWTMMARSQQAQLCKRALHQDDGQVFVLSVSVFASMAVLVAAGSQMAIVKDMQGGVRIAHIVLAACTVAVAWLFVQTTFALHYAHQFFLARIRSLPEGLQFPGSPDPVYVDFMYFACVIGTSGQTADVSFVGTAMRKIGMIHCVLAFFFNVAMIGLTINIAASLF